MLMRGSVTELTKDDRGAHAIVGSHGGARSGFHAASCEVASLICHDAGVGMDEAGVAALGILERFGMPAAAVSHESAHIGDPQDMFDRGIISWINEPGTKAGLVRGMRVRAACAVLEGYRSGHAAPTSADHVGAEFRRQRIPVNTTSGSMLIVVVDSASSVNEEDDGAIVVTGSHGGLPGGAAERALKARPLLVAFNDAGIGLDNAGISRLPVLGAMGIAAICVSGDSARIGDGLSTYQTGVVSVANDTARALGARTGMPLIDLVSSLAARPVSHQTSAASRTPFK